MSIVFFVSAKTQHQNLGDAIITRELLRLASRFGSIELNLGGMPADFLATIEAHQHAQHRSGTSFVRQIVVQALRARLSKAAPRACYLLNPGGFNGGMPLADVPRQLALMCAYALLALLGVRLMRVGCSIGPFSASRLVLERLKMPFLYRSNARDSLSIAYAQAHGLGRLDHFPDLALLLEAPTAGAAAAEPCVVLSFKSEPQATGYDDHILAALRHLLEAPHLRGCARLIASQVSFDLPRSRALAQQLQSPQAPVQLAPDTTFEAVCRLYAGAQAVFSNRLHVLLFALRQGVPTYAVIDPAVNQKIAGIFNDLGLADFIVDIRAPDRALGAPDAARHREFTARLFDAQAELARRAFADRVVP